MGMFSNGTMFKKFDMFEELAKSLTWIRVSLDGSNEASYNKLRVQIKIMILKQLLKI